MLMGAFCFFYVVYVTGNPWLGLLAAVLIGAALGLAMAFVSVTLRAEARHQRHRILSIRAWHE